MGERRLCKPEVTGSIPVISTRVVFYRSFSNCSLTIEYELGIHKFAKLKYGFFAEHNSDLLKTCFGQANKGIRWMPWYREAMKDVVSCDKPRGGANNL